MTKTSSTTTIIITSTSTSPDTEQHLEILAMFMANTAKIWKIDKIFNSNTEPMQIVRFVHMVQTVKVCPSQFMNNGCALAFGLHFMQTSAFPHWFDQFFTEPRVFRCFTNLHLWTHWSAKFERLFSLQHVFSIRQNHPKTSNIYFPSPAVSPGR